MSIRDKCATTRYLQLQLAFLSKFNIPLSQFCKYCPTIFIDIAAPNKTTEWWFRFPNLSLRNRKVKYVFVL